MFIDVLTHVPFEGAANIGVWAKDRGHKIRYCRLYEGQPLPDSRDVEFAAIMGGPMNIYEYDQFPWLRREKEFIGKIIDRGVMTLGVCLGGQLIAEVLGGKVVKNKYKEIGWWEVDKTAESTGSVFDVLPERFMTFQWHGDMFKIPAVAVRLGGNQACENQAFAFGDNVLGLQFHIEYDRDSIADMNEQCRDELLSDSIYVQSEEYIIANLDKVEGNRKLLFTLLDEFCKRNGK